MCVVPWRHGSKIKDALGEGQLAFGKAGVNLVPALVVFQTPPGAAAT